MFEEQVSKTPNASAVVFEEQILTYADLNSRANKLAYLLIGIGVKADSLVAIALDRLPEMIIALLATLKAGGAYVPLDPDYPLDRLAFMLADSDANILITMKALREQLQRSVEHIICLDIDHQYINTQPDSNPNLSLSLENLAYVIYTSGSTGRPKGVEVAHFGLSNLIKASITTFSLSAQSRVLQFASFSFDASVWEVMMAIGSGAALYLPNKEQRLPGDLFLQYLDEVGITHVLLPPTTLAVFPPTTLSKLKYLIVGGETCPPALASLWSKGRRFFNAYGPTEITVCATIAECDHDKIDVNLSLPIGLPIPNTRLYVLNAHNQPAPPGVSGELHIGGVGLARGYLNLPELTAEKFIPDPFSSEPGARLYKTGDLVRYRHDGNLEFLGRIDHQIKIRGYRIEPEEIEKVLMKHADVSEAVVILREDEPEHQTLVAYVVSKHPAKNRTPELRNLISSFLPAYMMPSLFVFLEKMPLTLNGKIDRNALSNSDRIVESTNNYTPARDEIEEQLVKLWEEVIGVNHIGIHDNFFEIGGNSLSAVVLLSKFKNIFHTTITIKQFFEAQTIAKFAYNLKKNAWKQSEYSSIVTIQEGKSETKTPPLFFIHVLGIGMKYCRPIAKYIGSDLYVYGLSINLMEHVPDIANRVEDLARFYISEVKKISPDGPYFLIGFSFGGLVAFEMARQLKENGDDIRFVGLVDTVLYNAFKKVDTARRLKEHHDNLKNQGAQYLLKKGFNRLNNEYLLYKQKVYHYFLSMKLWYYNITGRKHQMPIGLKEYAGWSANKEAAFRYTPHAYNGKVTLFKSDEKSNEIQYLTDPELGWGKMALGGVDTIECHGDHVGIIEEPNVQKVAKSLRQAIDRALNPEIPDV